MVDIVIGSIAPVRAPMDQPGPNSGQTEAEILHIEIEEHRRALLDLPARLLHERRHRQEPRELIAPLLAKRKRQR